MDTLNYDYKVHQTPNAGDDQLAVKFFTDILRDETASVEAGRPIFKDVEWIHISIPGSKDNVVVRPVRYKGQRNDVDRFPRHYAMFKNRIEGDDQTIGTRLEQWPLLTRSQVEELKFFNIKTVEQLASAADGVAQKFMNFHSIKQKAKDFLEAAAGNAPLAAIREEFEALKMAHERVLVELQEWRDAAVAKAKKEG